MEIIIPPNFISSLKNKHLLLDTNIFLDAAFKTTTFIPFFNELKSSDVTIVTLDAVKFELLKGSATTIKYQEKESLINDIIDATVPTTSKNCELIYDLIKAYGIDGTDLSTTDLFLGSALMQYGKNIFLLTRDTTDFLQRIFDLTFVLNLPTGKGIKTYGVYTYSK